MISNKRSQLAVSGITRGRTQNQILVGSRRTDVDLAAGFKKDCKCLARTGMDENTGG